MQSSSLLEIYYCFALPRTQQIRHFIVEAEGTKGSGAQGQKGACVDVDFRDFGRLL